MASRLSGAPSFIIEPKSWDVDGLEYGALELSANTINVSLAGVATALNQATELTTLASILTKLNASLAVTAASLPLPSNAAAESGGNLAALVAKDYATQTTLALIKAKTDNLDTLLSSVITASGILGGKTLKSAKFSLTATGSVVAAVASKRIKVYAYKLVVSAAVAVKWRSGASTDLEDLQPLALSGGEAESIMPPAFLFGTVAGESLDMVISGIGTVSGRISYFDDDAS